MLPLQERRILVVEDEALLGLMTSDTLADAGAVVVGPAVTVEEALAILREDRPLDGAVLDLNLGGEMSEAVAGVLIEHQIPFVIATGYGAGILPLVEQKALGVLVKPYEPAELVGMLAAACRSRGRPADAKSPSIPAGGPADTDGLPDYKDIDPAALRATQPSPLG